jgi:hypothetical protein
MMATYRVFFQYADVPDYLPAKKREIEAESIEEAESQIIESEKKRGNILRWINADRIKSQDEIRAEMIGRTRWERPDDAGGGVY